MSNVLSDFSSDSAFVSHKYKSNHGLVRLCVGRHDGPRQAGLVIMLGTEFKNRPELLYSENWQPDSEKLGWGTLLDCIQRSSLEV